MPRFKIQFKLETTTSEQISTEEIKDDIALIQNSNFWEQNQADIIHDLTSGSNTEIQEQIKGYFKSVGLSDNVNFSKIYSYNSYIVFTNDEDVQLFIDPTQPTAFKLNTVPLDDDSNIKIKFFKNWVETYKENNAGLFKVIHNHFLNPDNNYYIDIFEMETNPNNLVEFLETLSDTDSITTFVNLLPEIDKITDSYIIQTLIDTINDEMCNM